MLNNCISGWLQYILWIQYENMWKWLSVRLKTCQGKWLPYRHWVESCLGWLSLTIKPLHRRSFCCCTLINYHWKIRELPRCQMTLRCHQWRRTWPCGNSPFLSHILPRVSLKCARRGWSSSRNLCTADQAIRAWLRIRPVSGIPEARRAWTRQRWAWAISRAVQPKWRRLMDTALWGQM